MKPVRIHPPSALAGAGLLGLVLLATGALRASVPIQEISTLPRGPVRVAGIPDPRDMIVVTDNTPLVVPAGKLFVATGLGMNAEGGQLLTLWVNGESAVILRMELASGVPSIRSLPP